MKSPYRYNISHIGLEPLARNVAENVNASKKIFNGDKLFLSTNDEDQKLKTDIKNTTNLLTVENIKDYATIKIKSKSSLQYHYALSNLQEIYNNKYCIFYKAPFEENDIKNTNMLYDFDVFAQHLMKCDDNKKIYIVKSEYLRILKEHKDQGKKEESQRYFKFYDNENQWRVTDNDLIENPSKYGISNDYVIEYILTNDDIENLREEFIEKQKEIKFE